LNVNPDLVCFTSVLPRICTDIVSQTTTLTCTLFSDVLTSADATECGDPTDVTTLIADSFGMVSIAAEPVAVPAA
jgi:hypothetical protein